jgi:hypothetical protein
MWRDKTSCWLLWGWRTSKGLFLAQVAEGDPVRILASLFGRIGSGEPGSLYGHGGGGIFSGIGRYRPRRSTRFLGATAGSSNSRTGSSRSQRLRLSVGNGSETGAGTHQLAGTVYGRGDLRFVRIDELPVDVNPQGYLMVMSNEDRPGRCGHTGTVFRRGESISPGWTSLGIGREGWRFLCGAWTPLFQTMCWRKSKPPFRFIGENGKNLTGPMNENVLAIHLDGLSKTYRRSHLGRVKTSLGVDRDLPFCSRGGSVWFVGFEWVGQNDHDQTLVGPFVSYGGDAKIFGAELGFC